MPVGNIVNCGHCSAKGRCQCDECQTLEFGESYRRDGHYARCGVCGGAGKVAVRSPTVECSHCNGGGHCQCDGCQKQAFGQTYRRDGHYARCAACGGSGRARIRVID